MSFRSKTIIGIAIIEALLLIVLLCFGARLLYDSAGIELTKRADTASTLFSTMAQNAVLTTDIASLESFVSTIISKEDIIYARVYDNHKLLAAAGNVSHFKNGIQTLDKDINLVTDNIFDTTHLITIFGNTIGRVEVGFSTNNLKQLITEALQKGTTIALLEMILVAAFSLFLGNYLTRQLRELEHSSVQIFNGNYGYQTKIRGNDELARTANAFNTMSNKVQTTLDNLEVALEDARNKSILLTTREQTLKESYTRYAAVLDNANEAIIIINSKGIIESFNPAAETIFGYQAKEVINKNVKSLMPPPDHDRHDLYLSNYLETGIKKIIGNDREVTGQHKNGSRIAIELSISEMELGGKRYFNGIIRDITEQKKTQKKLERFSRELNAIFNLSSDGFIAFNETGIVNYVNPAFTKMIATERRQLEGITISQFDSIIKNLVDKNSGTYITTSKLNDKNADIITIFTPKPKILSRSLRILKDDNDIYLGQVLYFRDITYETEVDIMKSNFLSTAAHELRTPMASIHGYSELLIHRDYPEEQQKKLLKVIYKQSTSLINMVNELLDLARIESRAGKDFHIIPHDIFALVRETAINLDLTNESHQLSIELDDIKSLVLIDKNKILQALTNILSNSYKYSPHGGLITISHSTRLFKQQNQTGIKICDQGIGMTFDQQSKVFERFYRADESGNIPGTGLGMCLVKEIMDIHQGEVEIQSESDVGTCVTLWFKTVE